MEDAPRLSLKWNHFKENFTSQFGFLKEEEEFVDVTFSCQGKLLRAHKIILSASSPYLTALFKENPCKHPVVILDDLPYTHLESLLAFIYTGAVSVLETELPAFLESANLLQIRGLSDKTPLPFSSQPNPQQSEANPRKRVVTSADLPDFPTPPKRTSSKTDLVRRQPKTPVSDTEVKTEESFDLVKPEPDFELKNEHARNESGVDPLPVEGAETPSYASILNSRHDWESNASNDVEYAQVDGRRKHSLDPRPCPICNRLYSNLSNLRQHLRLIHNPTVVTCKLCLKTFKTDLYLRRHLISYHGINLAFDAETGGDGNRKNVSQPPPCFKELLVNIQMNPVQQ